MAANLTGCASNGTIVVMPNGVMDELGAQAEAARRSDSPGGATVTPAERDAMESHARTRLQGLYSDFAGRLDARAPLTGALKACRDSVGFAQRVVAQQAKGMVDVALRPSEAPPPPAPPQSPPPQPQGPLTRPGYVYDI